MKHFTQKLIGLLTIVFTISSQISAQNICVEFEDPSNIWDYQVTDANMNVQVSESIFDSNEQIPIGIGGFYINQDDQLQCAGYSEYNGDQVAVAIWESMPGLDNGFYPGDQIIWIFNIENEDLTVALSISSIIAISLCHWISISI